MSNQSIDIFEAVSFASNGPSFGTAITHAPGTTDIVINTAGTYFIVWRATSQESNQFAIWRGLSPIPESRHSVGMDSVNNAGSFIVDLAAVPVTLTLRNNSSFTTVVVSESLGGSETSVSASINIFKIR
ncbi:hypothetical protein [Cohnella faecalis]|nr:hypothetical protein [Cohnella faecalis]